MTSLDYSGAPLVMDDAGSNRNMPDDQLVGLRASFGAVFEHAPTGMALVDLHGRYVQVNDRLCELTGYAPDELVGRSLWALTHPEDLVVGQLALQNLLEHGTRFEVQKRFRRKDGQVAWVVLSGSLLLGQDDRPLAFLCHVQDMTERKWAEDALVAQHATMQLVQTVTVAANEASSVEEAAAIALRAVGAHAGWPVGQLWLRTDERTWSPADVWHCADPQRYGRLRHAGDASRPEPAAGLPAAVARAGGPRWVAELAQVKDAVAEAACALGLRSAFAFPVLVTGEVAAVLLFYAPPAFEPDGVLLEAMAQIGTQLGHVIERARASAALRASEERSREAQERFEKAFSNAPIGMALVGLDGTVQEVNLALCDLLGYAPAELLGTSLRGLTHVDDAEASAQLQARARAGELHAFTVETRFLRADGVVIWTSVSASVVTDAEQRPRYFVWHVEDITERKAAEAQLTWRALHDPLTGLANRALFLDHVEQALRRAERRPSSAAVMFCDLDNFKAINDERGHEAGDQVLLTVAARLRACVRPSDTVARLGGDEFVVLCEGLAGEHEAVQIAERLEDALLAPVEVGGEDLTVTASVGIAVASDPGMNAQTLLKQADTAMYRAKALGKARFELFDQLLADSIQTRVEVEQALRRALSADRLHLLFQPTVELASRRVVGVEALLRYTDDAGVLRAPAEFLDVAEDSGLIVAMGAWALREASRHAGRWAQLRRQALRVSVNLSGRELGRRDFVDVVQRALSDVDTAPDSLSLEVTEGVLLSAASDAVHGLYSLRRAGVLVGLDDFGTGPASVGDLAAGSLDYLKIDRSLIARVADDAYGEEAVRTIIDLAHTLGMVAVAEGVETEEQALLLCRLGCDLAQGFHFAAPQPPDAIDAFVGP